MSATFTPPRAPAPDALAAGARAPGAAAPGAAAPEASTNLKRRIRYSTLGLLAVALAFYLGFIVLLVSRSHH